MTVLFEKIAENFTIDWDLDVILSKFTEEKINPNTNYLGQHKPYSDPNAILHWQVYPGTGIAFARNFYVNCKDECELVVAKLKELQQEYVKTCDINSEFGKAFSNHEIKSNRVNMLRVASGVDANPHVDVTRDVCINIGLRNSDTGVTCISEHKELSTFWDNPYESFVMNDGDVYMVNVKHSHAVKSLTTPEVNSHRYIITYNLLNR